MISRNLNHSRNALRRLGWTRDFLNVGAAVTVFGSLGCNPLATRLNEGFTGKVGRSCENDVVSACLNTGFMLIETKGLPYPRPAIFSAQNTGTGTRRCSESFRVRQDMHTSDRLTELATLYDRQAQRCSKARAYLAATIMQAAALEAALLAMCFLYPEHVRKTNIFHRKRFRNKRNRALEFNLYELAEIAAELAWFPPTIIKLGRKRTNLKELVHQVREIRNFVHPGKWAREHPATTKSNKQLYTQVEEVFDVARSWLLHRVEERLRKRMKREGLV